MFWFSVAGTECVKMGLKCSVNFFGDDGRDLGGCGLDNFSNSEEKLVFEFLSYGRAKLIEFILKR